MHASVLFWVAQMVEKYDLAGRTVLEVGSYDVNGSVRPLFESDDYIGLDQDSGPSVDVVGSAHALPFEGNEFDVVVSTEMLEHDGHFWLSLKEMGRVLRTGGVLLLTTRSNGFPLHRFPVDCYRFMPDSIPTLLRLASCSSLEAEEDPEQSGLFIAGRRRQVPVERRY